MLDVFLQICGDTGKGWVSLIGNLANPGISFWLQNSRLTFFSFGSLNVFHWFLFSVISGV
jgi:hypothetical protein